MGEARVSTHIYTTAQLIAEWGEKVVGRYCTTCGRDLLWEIVGYKGQPSSFLLCLACDTTREARDQAGLRTI
jgi:hypothetical protein